MSRLGKYDDLGMGHMTLNLELTFCIEDRKSVV